VGSGEALLHHRERAGVTWTALAFWDRSVDDRYGSNSVFILRGALSFEEAVTLAREQFPEVWARFSFTVREFSPTAMLEGAGP
jgi:hypothetical protein